MNDELKEKLANVGVAPGVYLMKNAAGRVIYVGKARALRKRLASYFKPADQLDIKTGVLVRQIADFDTILTGTEKEALILEQTLIKKYRPRYNVVLKDDKRYPSLRLNMAHPYPNLTIVRRRQRDGARYFGPFSSAQAVRQTLKFINKTFKLRKCSDREFATRTRPCLHHQMRACFGPCCKTVPPAEYADMVRQVEMFLKGRTPDLIRELREGMAAAAERQDFEHAAVLRDKVFALEKTLERQVAVVEDRKDRDVIAVARSATDTVVMLMVIRNGYLVGSRHFEFAETISEDAELVASFLLQYYEHLPQVPPEILVPVIPAQADLLTDRLREWRGRGVRVHHPQRGEKARILDMARQNAESRLSTLAAIRSSQEALLAGLERQIRLQRHPDRIECFDISNTGGRGTVASMVVFARGKPDPSAYRKFKIRTVSGPDDYAAMAEVLRRRFREQEGRETLPDLLMVDGGRGQLGIAVDILTELGLADAMDVIGIAKKDESRGDADDKIYKPGRVNPMPLDRHPELLHLLQQVRDEAHRFAITFHRQQRGRSAVASVLDGIPGIGPARKATLLRHFGGVAAIADAAEEAIAGLHGFTPGLARIVLDHLAAGDLDGTDADTGPAGASPSPEDRDAEASPVETPDAG